MILALVGLAFAAAPAGLADAGRAQGGPIALLVPSPGLAPEATELLAERLERGGWDAWRLDLSASAPEDATTRTIPDAVAALRARGEPVLLVGEGLGGRFAARSVSEGQARPDALALLGAPLDLRVVGGEPVALLRWLSERPLPEGDLDLGSLTEARWSDQPVLELLLGAPLPPLGLLPRAWAAALQAEIQAAPVSLDGVDIPVWAATSQSDDLAPPEAVRPLLGRGEHTRIGYLNLDSREPEHGALLTDPATARALLRWARPLRSVRESPPG